MALNDEMVTTGNNDVYFASSIQIYKIRASDQLIEHVAGTADFKDGDQGETALKARFRNIVAFHVRQIDSTNIELYIIDSDRIRKIFSNGTVVTICGSTNGFEGDGGLAINAKLSNPKDLFVWKEELFILDYGNNRIRKISKDGIISTIAGTGERGSTFSGTRPARETPISPESFSCSRTGIIYIKGFKDVLGFDLRSGNITFLFKRNILETIRVVTLPSGIDELYFSDGVYVLRRDEFGNITTIAGCESRDITNSTMDGYMANQVYISVQKFFIRLNQQGNVEFYFGDDKLIRKVDEKGKIWTIFGSRDGTIEFFSIPATYSITLSPTDATVTENGDILFYDNNVNLRKLKRDGQLEIVSAPSINFGPCTNGDKISFDSFSFVTHTNIAVSGNKIYTILKKTNNSPKGTAADSLIKISDNQVCLLYGLPKYQANQTAATSILNDPRGIFVESGVIYFSDSLGHRVLKIEKDRIITIAGNSIAGYSGDGNLAINAMVNRPTALFVDAKQNIYIADSGNHRIRMINSENGIITTVAGNGIQGYSSENVLATNTSLNQPKGVFVNSKGEIYISDTGNNRIRKIDTNGFISTIAGTGYSGSTVNSNPLLCDLNGPSTIQEYSNTLYFADTNNHVIRKFGYNNRLETVVGQLGVGGIGGGGIDSSLLYYPEGFHVFNAYSTFITDTANNRIARLEFSNLNTKLRDYTRPTSIFCISGYGFEYYFTSNDKIYYVNTYSFGGIKVIAGGVGDDATVEYSKLSLNGLHATRDYIYVADASNNRIRRISIETGIITTVAGSGDYGYSGDNGLALLAKLASPENVFVTERGDIYISDTGNYRIRRVDSQTGIITTIAGNGLQGYSEDNQLAITSRIDSPTRIYVSSNSEVFFLQKETSDYSTEIAKTKLTKISKNGMLSILPFSSVTSISGFSNSGDLVIISESTIYKLSLSCPENFTLSVDFTTCVPTCGGISSENGTACSSLGSCIAPNTCICKEHYNGTYCELAICTQGCVFGTCTKPNHCECEKGYYGVNCSLNDNIWIISISVVISVFSLLMITLILTTVSCILYKRYRKEKIILQTDSSLSSKLLTGFETEMESPSIRSQSSTYSTLFIPLEQLDLNKPIKRLGGGAFGFVLQCYWNTTIVAVKVFDLNNMNISEEDFTLEAGVLSSLRHPNIINFFGVSFSPTKRYIVMECLEQSLDKVIADLNIGLIRKSLPEKVRILLDVTKGINYLHTLENKIIHRDLKPANILLDKNGICKLCDFGLSRALSKNTFSALTHNLGTQHYWAPETQFDDQISRSEATAIDVFSFSIIMYQLLMEMKDPYIYTEEKTMQKLGLSSPKTFNNSYHLNRQIVEFEYRPTIPFTNLDECTTWCQDYLKDEPNNSDIFFELCELTKQCWSGNPNKRPTITEVIEKLTNLENELSKRR